MKEYNILGVKVNILPEHIMKGLLNQYLLSDGQHQIVTVNSEFIVSAQKNEKFREIINKASMATIDGSGPIKALQIFGQEVSLDDRITGVDLAEALIKTAIDNNYKILFCLKNKGLTKIESFFIKIKELYPNLDFQVADENSSLEKGQAFKPHIILLGFGAPEQDMWISYNMPKIPSAKIGVGVGGTFDFISGRTKRAPKILRSIGLEWLWRMFMHPNRLRRISRATIVFPYLVFKDKIKKSIKRYNKKNI